MGKRIKQHITEEQWDELNIREQNEWCSEFHPLSLEWVTPELITDEEGIDFTQREICVLPENKNEPYDNVPYDELQYPNIGQMIEFLGDELIGIWRGEDYEGWEVDVCRDFEKYLKSSEKQLKTFIAKELCDALWSACRYKLSK